MTEDQYISKIELLASVGCNHPLWPKVRAGYSPANAIYLRSILETWEPPPQVQSTQVEESTALKVLYARKQRLFGERAQFSNKMCALPEERRFDEERGRYSDLIQAKQKEIKSVMREIALHEAGHTPVVVGGSLPMSEADQIRKLASLRAARSRKRANAKTLTGEDLAKCEADIEKFTKEIEYVESLSKY